MSSDHVTGHIGWAPDYKSTPKPLRPLKGFCPPGMVACSPVFDPAILSRAVMDDADAEKFRLESCQVLLHDPATGVRAVCYRHPDGRVLLDTIHFPENEKRQDTVSPGPAPTSMYHAWCAFVDIRRDRYHEFPTYDAWILSDDPECRAFRQGWSAHGKTVADPGYYGDDHCRANITPKNDHENTQPEQH